MTAGFHYRNWILGIKDFSLLTSNISISGLTINKSTFQGGSEKSFPGRREYEFA